MGEFRAAAEKVLDLVEVDPGRAYESGVALLADPEVPAAARSIALRAMGVAARNRTEIRASLRHLEDAIAAAEEAGEVRLAAEARMSMAATLTYAGRTGAALEELDRAATHLDGAERARLEFQRAGVLQRLGRPDEALAGYDAALPMLRRAGDQMYEAHLLANRGLLLAYAGQLGHAERDHLQALELYRRLGLESAAAVTTHNLGFVATRQGAVARALAWFDEAENELRRLGRPAGALPLDRCEALLAAGLAGRARVLAAGVVEELAAAGMEADRAEALLMHAEAALLDGDYAAARSSAAAAGDAFRSQRRPGWLARARYALHASGLAAGSVTGRDLTDANRLARALEKAGQAVPALQARVMAVRSAVALGKLRSARANAVHLAPARSAGPAGLRIQAWLATAELRHAGGDRVGAGRAAQAGLAAFDRYQAALGATDARAHAARHVVELSDLVVRRAVESGRAARIFRASEQTRARSLRCAPVRPPDDEDLARDLDALRSVTAGIRAAELAGTTALDLRARQQALQEAIRRRALRTPGSAFAGAPVPTLGDVQEALGGRTLLQYVAAKGQLHGVAVTAARARWRPVAAAAGVAAEVESLRFALRRLVDPQTGAASRAAATALMEAATRRLDSLLVAPFDLPDGPVVVVPPGALFALPWAALPSLGERPLAVAPSAATWLAGRARRPARDKVVIAAGPGLPEAAAEVEALRQIYPDAVRFSPNSSPVDEVLGAIDGAGTAHLACHGTHAAQNPLFSTLLMSDGPLTVYDLERVAEAPGTLVLSACDSGLSAVRPGDELIGLATSILAMGTSSLVASVAPVPDAAITRALMVAFHEALGAGREPAVALAEARAALGAPGEAGSIGTLFQCFGSG